MDRDLGTLFDHHWPLVWRTAYALSGQRELASDAAQDTFLRLADALPRLDRSRSLEPWLVRVVANRTIDLLRAQRRLAALEEAEAPVAYDEPIADVPLRRALAALDPARRAVVVLHYWLDYTTPEIAEALDLPLGTVASRLSRALADLRSRLEAEHV